MEKAYDALAEIDPDESPAAKKAYNRKQKDFIGYYAAYQARGGKSIKEYEAKFQQTTNKDVFKASRSVLDSKDAENKDALNKQDTPTEKELEKIRKNLIFTRKIAYAIKNSIPIEEIEYGYEFPEEITNIRGKRKKTSKKDKKENNVLKSLDFNIEDLLEKELEQKLQPTQRATDKNSCTLATVSSPKHSSGIKWYQDKYK